MPSREVGQVRIDHLCRIVEFLLGEGFRYVVHTQPGALQRCYDSPSISPAMKVAAVEREHLADKTKFLLPELSGLGLLKPLSALFQQPEAIVPDPVAFGVFSQKR